MCNIERLGRLASGLARRRVRIADSDFPLGFGEVNAWRPNDRATEIERPDSSEGSGDARQEGEGQTVCPRCDFNPELAEAGEASVGIWSCGEGSLHTWYV